MVSQQKQKQQHSMTTTRSKIVIILSLSCLLFLSSLSVVHCKTIRYRNGVLDGDFFETDTLTIPAARSRCSSNSFAGNNQKCVSFSFSSPSRFPEEEVMVYFFAYADWHIKLTGEPSFVEDPTWHTYVNTTREMALIEPEANQVLSQLKNNPTKLRGGSGSTTNSIERDLVLLQSLFDIVTPKPHRVIAAPIISPYAVSISSDVTKPVEVRLMAMKLLIMLGDSSETGKILIQNGTYQAMKNIITSSRGGDGGKNWSTLAETALDVIANICIFRSANAELRDLGAVEFFHGLLSEPGFPGLQAAIAFTHLGDFDLNVMSLPQGTIEELMKILKSAIDGDISHGILWDLVPGPLTSIKYLVMHGNNLEGLLDAGLMEELLRILESSDNASELIVTLEIMMELSKSSERAREMILLADHTIKDMQERLNEFRTATNLASELSNFAVNYDNSRMEL